MKTKKEFFKELKRKTKRSKRKLKLKEKNSKTIQNWLKNSNFFVKLPNI